MEEKRKISTEKALAILKEKGISLIQEDAEQVVELLYQLAQLFYTQYAAEL